MLQLAEAILSTDLLLVEIGKLAVGRIEIVLEFLRLGAGGGEFLFPDQELFSATGRFRLDSLDARTGLIGNSGTLLKLVTQPLHRTLHPLRVSGQQGGELGQIVGKTRSRHGCPGLEILQHRLVAGHTLLQFSTSLQERSLLRGDLPPEGSDLTTQLFEFGGESGGDLRRGGFLPEPRLLFLQHRQIGPHGSGVGVVSYGERLGLPGKLLHGGR